jgi:hypothetical protein
VFLAAARDMLGGLPGAIFMFKAVTDSQGTAQVMPVIVTNRGSSILLARSITGKFTLQFSPLERITIAAKLVSHPS